tara:strand:+ start:839 stop:1240 length:402 start_codon:yes stop_codon:yes gene_type:complete
MGTEQLKKEYEFNKDHIHYTEYFDPKRIIKGSMLKLESDKMYRFYDENGSNEDYWRVGFNHVSDFIKAGLLNECKPKPSTIEGCSMSWNKKPIPVFTPEELAVIKMECGVVSIDCIGEQLKLRQSIVNKINKK